MASPDLRAAFMALATALSIVDICNFLNSSGGPKLKGYWFWIVADSFWLQEVGNCEN